MTSKISPGNDIKRVDVIVKKFMRDNKRAMDILSKQ